MPNLTQEVSMSIIDKIGKIHTIINYDIQKQIEIRNIIEEVLNNYELTSKCTEIATGDVLEKAYIFLSCKQLEGMKKTTIYNYTLLFKKMHKYFIKPVTAITTMDLRLFLRDVYPDNQPASLNNKICKIKAFFSWLQDEGYLLQNTSKNLQLVAEPYRKREHIPQIDIEKMREACKSTREKAMFEFLLSTGCRVSEVSTALISRVDWDKNSIYIIGKGDKERLVFFSVRARMFLIKYIKEREEKGILSDYLFVASKIPHGNLGQRSIQKDVKDIAARAGITSNVFPHLFRHTFATNGVNRNVPLPVLSQLMGHSSADTTQVYFTLNDDIIKHEYKKIAL